MLPRNVIVLVLAFACFIGRAIGENEESSKSYDIFEYLYEMGSRCDCYFTLEIRGEIVAFKVDSTGKNVVDREKTMAANQLYHLSLKIPENANNPSIAIEAIRRDIPGVKIVIDAKDSRIIHIQDNNVLETGVPILNQHIDIKFVGTPYDLVRECGSKCDMKVWTLDVKSAGSFDGDNKSKIEVDMKDSTLRDVLTFSVPDTNRYRILWIAKTYQKEPDFIKVAIVHNGKK